MGIADNVRLMESAGEGGMARLLLSESWGGNAGRTKDGRICAGASFYFDKESGDIVYFENCQYVPDDIMDKYSNGLFRVAGGQDRSNMEIVETIYEEHVPMRARVIIGSSVEAYNYRQRGKI